jgi:hypothetical protein
MWELFLPHPVLNHFTDDLREPSSIINGLMFKTKVLDEDMDPFWVHSIYDPFPISCFGFLISSSSSHPSHIFIFITVPLMT